MQRGRSRRTAAGDRDRTVMKKTPFPTRPAEVAPLTVQEFTFDFDAPEGCSLDAICARFVDDANRALVWLVRFRALKALIDQPGMAAWIGGGARTQRDACEVAAGFALNERWEFDAEPFCCAVDTVVSRRSRRWHA